jgi:hypothetical protein
MKRLIAILAAFILAASVCSFNVIAIHDADEYFEEQLTEDEQVIYEAFIKAATTGSEKITGLKTVKYTYTASSNITSNQMLDEFISNDATFQSEMAKLNGMFHNAITAAMMDHPEYYWIDNKNAAELQTSANCSGRNVTIEFSISATGKSNSNALIDEVDNKLKSMNAKGTELEKLKTIHKWLCDNVSYVSGTNAHNLYGALFEGKAVCQGYAEAFKAACDYYDIHCVCVEGDAYNAEGNREAHMWNYVELNGFWYAVDVTWDDQTSGIMEDFYLVGSSTKAEHFDNMTFEQSHTPDGRLGGTSAKIFNYPALSLKAYGAANNTSAPVKTASPAPTTKAPTSTIAPPTKAPQTTTKAPDTSTTAPTVTQAPTVTGAPTVTEAPSGDGATVTGDISKTPDASVDTTPTNEITQDKTDATPTAKNEAPKEEKSSVSVVIIAIAAVVACGVIGTVVIVVKRKK